MLYIVATANSTDFCESQKEKLTHGLAVIPAHGGIIGHVLVWNESQARRKDLNAAIASWNNNL